MKFKIIDYFLHPEENDFEQRLIVYANLILCILSLSSMLTTLILVIVKPHGYSLNIKFLTYNSIFWLLGFLTTIIVAETVLHENYYKISRLISLYLYSCIFYPIGMYISGTNLIPAMYYVLCIVIFNVIANKKERLIINPFLFIFTYTYIIISYQFPDLLPPPPSQKTVYILFLINIPVILILTAFLVGVIVETFRKEHIKIKRQNSKLEQIIQSDRLTGLYNKSHLNEQLPRLLNNAYHHKSPLAVFFIDIDFFKNYNTLYGNIKGDSCLIEVANILKKNCANITNHIYRFGGEEFIIILPDTDPSSARILAESIREDFHIRQIDNYRSSICNYITVSIGIHCYSGLFKTTTDQVVKKANSALYTVKRKGRDDYYIDTSYEDY